MCQWGNEAIETPHAHLALPEHRVPWHSHPQSTEASIGMGDQLPAAIGLAACQLHGKHKVENKSPLLQITAWAKENQYIVTSHCLNAIKRSLRTNQKSIHNSLILPLLNPCHTHNVCVHP